MKIPKSIRVNGNKWTTRYKWGLVCPENGEKLDGLNEPINREIFLERSMSKEDKERAYLHELGHSLFVENHLREVVSIEVEELVVEMYAQFLHGRVRL